MTSKIITLFWISLLLLILPGCRLHNPSQCEGVSKEEEIKLFIEALIKYGFKSECVSDNSGRITLPRQIFNIEWEKYSIDPTAFDFNNRKFHMLDKKAFREQSIIIYNATSQDIYTNSWKISIDEKFSYEELVKSLKSYSLRYEDLKILCRVNYCFHMDNCKIEISYCNSLDKLPPPETFSMISQDLFSNILDCMEER